MRLLFNIYLFAIMGQLYSQVVNIEQSRLKSKGKNIYGNILLDVKYIKNTKELIQGKSHFQLQYKKNKHTLLFLGNLAYISADNQSFLNSGFGHIRYNYTLSERWVNAEFFIQNQYNEIQKIGNRSLKGVGPRFKLIEEDTLHLYFGSLFMHETEHSIDELEPAQSLWRLSNYLSFAWRIKPDISIQTISYYQPALSSFSDYRFTNETTLNLKIFKGLIFYLKFRLLIDTTPLENVPQNIYSLANGLKYQF